MNFDRVLPQIAVGSYPENTRDIDRLKQELGITAVLNLQTDEDHAQWDIDWDPLHAHYLEQDMVLRRVPVRDFDREDLRNNLPACVDALSELLQAGHHVYVHCTAGIGRSPSVVIAYLHWLREWNLDQAADHVNQSHPCSPDLDAIRAAGGDVRTDRDRGGPDRT
jgi:protein-tyrosine phosphatase